MSQWDAQLTTLAAQLDALIALAGQISPPQVTFETLADLLADTTRTAGMADGTLIRVLDHDGFDLIKVSAGIVNWTAASGSEFRVRMDIARPGYFGAIGDDDGVAGTDDRTALDAALASDAAQIDLAGRRYYYGGVFDPSEPVLNGVVRDTTLTRNYSVATGASGLPISETIDWNDATVTGAHYSNAAAANAPVATAARGLVISEAAGTVFQMVSITQTGAVYYRDRIAGLWSPWRKSTGVEVARTYTAALDDFIDIALEGDATKHMIVFENLKPEIDGNRLRMRMMTAPGIVSINTQSLVSYRNLDTIDGTGGSENFAISPNMTVSNVGGGGFSGDLSVLGAGNAERTMLTGSVVATQGASFRASVMGGLVFDLAEAHIGARLFFDSGRILSGKITVYAFPNGA